MSRTLFITCAAVAVILLPMFSLPASYAAEPCVVKANTLNSAKQTYNRQCTTPRADCDKFNSEWYCASFVMSSKIPPALTATTNKTNTSQNSTNQSDVSQSNTSQVSSTQSNSSQSNTNDTDVIQSTTASRSVTTCTRSDSDPDKDGWGWEDNRSCRVGTSIAITAPDTSSATPAASPPLTASHQQQTSATSRTSCKSASSDPDGDGWGWEDNRSCKVITQSNNTPAKSTSSNATTENPTAATTNPGSFTAASITDLVLITGQSNALGASTAYNASLDSPNNKVFAFTNNGWQVANLNQIWDRNWHPRNDPNTDPSNNFALHFGKHLVEKDSQRVVGFVLVTAPGAAIDNWKKGGDFYDTIQQKVLDAINQLPHKSQLNGILWHQGESDGRDEQYYTDALYTLIYNLRNEAWTQGDASFICGETKIAAVNIRLNGLNKDSDPKTACIAAANLSTRDDGAHFDANALRTMGKRYAEAYLNQNR